MATDSSVAGYLAPIAVEPYDEILDATLQAQVVGITGIPGNLVRPRWQPVVPNRPEHDVNWCAFGLTGTDPDVMTYERHDPTGDGSELVEFDEKLVVQHSFYGPASMANATRWRTGIMVSQNREALKAVGIVLMTVGSPASVPVLLAEKWQRRVDITTTYRRRAVYRYPILNVESMDPNSFGIDNEQYVTPIKVNNP